jgi:hypothetical protein
LNGDAVSTTVERLAGQLLVQCGADQAFAVADIAGDYGVGLVITGVRSVKVGKRLRTHGFAGPILFDAARYAGNTRSVATTGTTPRWIREQLGFPTVALTDSGYVRARDITGLRTVLRGAARTPETVAVLPLAAQWLKQPPFTDALRAELNRFGVPAAVIVEHRGDPFGAQEIIYGLRLLLTAEVPVFLLRTDLSTVGALCHGVHTAAIGTTTRLRHLYPPDQGKRRRPPLPQIAAMMPKLWSYHTLPKIEQVVERVRELGHYWICGCAQCGGAPLSRLADVEPRRAREISAFRHSFHLQLQLYRSIITPALDPSQLTLAWTETCNHALALHAEVRALLPGWTPPRMLGAWLQVGRDVMVPRQTLPGTRSRARQSPTRTLSWTDRARASEAPVAGEVTRER